MILGLKKKKKKDTSTVLCILKTLMEFQEQAEQNFLFLYTMTVNRKEK